MPCPKHLTNARLYDTTELDQCPRQNENGLGSFLLNLGTMLKENFVNTAPT
jgi:hypothetical protein